MIKLIRSYLLESNVIKKFVNSTSVKDALFFEFKPPIDIDQYIIIKEKPIDLGFIETYQLSFHIYSKDIEKVLEVEDELKRLLNDVRGDLLLYNDDVAIRSTEQLTGGGRTYDSDKDRIISVRYFLIKI